MALLIYIKTCGLICSDEESIPSFSSSSEDENFFDENNSFNETKYFLEKNYYFNENFENFDTFEEDRVSVNSFSHETSRSSPEAESPEIFLTKCLTAKEIIHSLTPIEYPPTCEEGIAIKNFIKRYDNTNDMLTAKSENEINQLFNKMKKRQRTEDLNKPVENKRKKSTKAKKKHQVIIINSEDSSENNYEANTNDNKLEYHERFLALKEHEPA
ncbi:hypothetical protein F8M41_016223 [Gigaspora margarita]|uniref:Uncharacterized protein n=1 Tax=Gigaspora margarita TaxID=4874 RepID=A0A8H4APT0_GIGMA|nr:hypothetical protein F8M41_016223 [Gigaspora margarita]